MIVLNDISKQYGKQVLFVETSFQLDPGEKVGLVGPNGAGKTTVFRMIVGEESPDEGDRVGAQAHDARLLPPGRRRDVGPLGAGRGHRRQRHAGRPAPRARGARSTPWPIPSAPTRWRRILERFGHVQEAYEQGGGYDLESRAREVLHGLGFEDSQVDGDVGALSGGWKMRVGARARAARAAGRAAHGRAHQPPRHRVHPLARDASSATTRARCS